MQELWTIDIECVQVNPTGPAKPDDAKAKIKFLAAETFRGLNGLVLNGDGEHFCEQIGSS